MGQNGETIGQLTAVDFHSGILVRNNHGLVNFVGIACPVAGSFRLPFEWDDPVDIMACAMSRVSCIPFLARSGLALVRIYKTS